MKVVVFGATGRVGRRAVKHALAEGHAVTAAARNPDILRGTAGLTIQTVDVLDAPQVAEILAGADAVVGVLGAAGLTEPGNTLSQGMRNIVAGARHHGVRRVVAVGGAGVLDSPEGGLRSEAPGYPEAFHAITREHAGTWAGLRESGLDWTLVCPPNLPDGDPTGRFRKLKDRLPEGGREISTGDVAVFVIDQLDSGEFSNARVGVAY